MKTTYYFYDGNAYNQVIAECGGKYVFVAENNGYDVTTGVDLYAADAIKRLREAYAEVDGLYNFEEIQQDFQSEIFNFEDIENEVTEIITVE